jgi:hypothetical protein
VFGLVLLGSVALVIGREDVMRGPIEARMERRIGLILRIGVSLAASIIPWAGFSSWQVTAGIRPTIGPFPRRSAEPWPSREAAHPNGRALIQLGVLLLVATLVARVVFSRPIQRGRQAPA